MALSPAEKKRRQRDRLLSKAREYTTGTYRNKFVAPLFQKVIRIEAAIHPCARQPAVVNGEIKLVFRQMGEVVCVTCGKVGPWSSGLAGMHTGHFLASRSNSIIFEEDGVAVQCSRCNRYEDGAPHRFRIWMLEVRGEAVVERLMALKPKTVQFSREELVDRRIWYQERLNEAEAVLKEHRHGRSYG